VTSTSGTIEAGRTVNAIGIVGLGTMGANIRARLRQNGIDTIGFDINPDITDVNSLEELVSSLPGPNRAVWVMVASNLTQQVIDDLSEIMEPGDIIIDGGNTHYVHDIRRAKELKLYDLHHMDVGTSGGKWGLERGYCLMIGGEKEVFDYLEPVFKALAPGEATAERTPGRTGPFIPAEEGYLYCGGHGAGHVVKMVHNFAEYGMMAAIAEALNLLMRFNNGSDPELSKLMADPELYQIKIDVPGVAEVWRRGSVVSSWLVDLTAQSLFEDPNADTYYRKVSDSGEGRWALIAAADTGTPYSVNGAALSERFSSQGSGRDADAIQNRQREGFGGHKK
jgi:6-phosphogluconate dehydrogenase